MHYHAYTTIVIWCFFASYFLQMIRLRTIATSKIIKQTMQALSKSKAISSGYKFQYAKYYAPDDSGRLQTHNIQIVVLHPAPAWDKSGIQILKNILKDFEKYDEALKCFDKA